MIETDWSGHVIALDVGGTAMKGAILSSDNTVESLHRWPTPREDGPDAVVNAVVAAIDELLEHTKDARAVGIVVPGLVDDHTGVALFSENIGGETYPFDRSSRIAQGCRSDSAMTFVQEGLRNESWEPRLASTTCCSCRSGRAYQAPCISAAA